MARTMRAAVVHAFGAPLEIQEVPIPTPGPGEVLIKLAANGVCHTDLHAADGDWPVKPKLPIIPGHEGAGFVAAVGAGVKNLKEGDPVGLAWLHDACGYCEFCRTGWDALCLGLPPGDFAAPIFDVVLGRITLRGSIVGGRQDLAEALAFAADGRVKAHIHRMQLEDINDVFRKLKAGTIDGRMVMTFN